MSSVLLAENLANLDLQHEQQTFEWIHKAMDGRIFTAEVRLKTFGLYNRELLLIAFVRDVTEQKRNEEILLINQLSFDKAAIAIFRSGSDGRIINVNEQACIDHGYCEADLCQMTIFDINKTIDKNNWEMVWQKLRSEKKICFETEHTRKDGSKFPVEITANFLVYKGFEFSLSFVYDISERKNSEKQKAKMQSALQQTQRLDSLGILAGGIAHDFNNILSAIIGYTDLTKINCLGNRKVQYYLDQLSSASNRAKNLVKQILNFSRQSGLEKQPVEIERIVIEALDLIRASIPSSIHITRNIPSNLGIVIANETQIHQIVINLCTNAYQAIKNEAGSIVVDLATINISRYDSVNYPDLEPGDYIKLIITDTGLGIPTEILSKIFDPYFTTKKVGDGTGLGLSTVHGIVKDHRGSIKVYSELDKGTTFQVFLPKANSKHTESQIKEEQLPRGTETILFVDDEKLLLEIGKELLESLGYRVETRASSVDALEAFRAQPEKYNLIVSDMTMPNYTGEYLAMEARKISPEIPIILCTGYSTSLDSNRLDKLGISKILMKPVTIHELALDVRLALDRKSK